MGKRVEKGPEFALRTALGITSAFTGIEVAAGLWSGSLALLADAGHMLGDVGALGLSLTASHFAQKARSASKTFGYRRAEVVGALLNALLLALVALWVLKEAFLRFMEPPQVRGMGVLVTAIAGLMVNLFVAWVLFAYRKQNLNIKSAMLHVFGDALGSLTTIVAGLALVGLGWRLADPLASLVIAALLLIGAARLFFEATHILMEGAPPDVDLAELTRTIAETSGVVSVHDLHVWTLTPAEPILTAHVVLDQSAHGVDVAEHIARRIARDHHIRHVTIQPEAPEPVIPLRLRS